MSMTLSLGLDTAGGLEMLGDETRPKERGLVASTIHRKITEGTANRVANSTVISGLAPSWLVV